MMTVWIGLTGAIGSGKSQVAAYFADLGVPIINADEIAKKLTDTPNSVALNKIKKIFGAEALDDLGRLNRDYMRQRVFTYPAERERLEAVLHPLILSEIQHQQTLQKNDQYGIIELPTLTEHPIFQAIISRVLLVMSEEKIRIERVMARSGLTESAVRSIIQAQASDAQRTALADDLICNDGNLNELKEAVWHLHQHYLQIV